MQEYVSVATYRRVSPRANFNLARLKADALSSDAFHEQEHRRTP
jgi:hypothetical protein